MKAGDTVKPDELKVYRGNDFAVSDNIVIHHPTLDEICEYGERDYFSMIHQLCATPQTMKVQLWDMGIDYTTITPFELFYHLLCQLLPQEKTSILFGSLDFTRFEKCQNEETDEPLLFQIVEHEPVIIDKTVYENMTDYIRQVHNIRKDEKMPANDTTKMILIEDDREELERNKHAEYHSQLKNLVSSMINSEGFKYNHAQVWDMKINAFMDSVRRISHIKNAELLLQSGYSGFGINLKDIDKKQIDWLGELT